MINPDEQKPKTLNFKNGKHLCQTEVQGSITPLERLLQVLYLRLGLKLLEYAQLVRLHRYLIT